jgi:hypothetical protein
MDDELLIAAETELGRVEVHLYGSSISIEHFLLGVKGVGGLLPPGTAGALVTDVHGNRHRAHAGNGAWVALLDQPEEAVAYVAYVDEAGEVVRVPRRDRPGEPVEDATVPCPACGAIDWERCEAAAEDDRDGSEKPLWWVVCRTCGRDEDGPTFDTERRLALSAHDAVDELDEEVPAWFEEFHEQERRRMRADLKQVRIPIYVPEDIGVQVRSYGGGDGSAVTDLSVDTPHPRGGVPDLTIEMGRTDDEYRGEREVLQELRSLLSWRESAPPAGSPAAQWLWRAAWRRELQHRGYVAAVETRTLLVDGIARPFLVASVDHYWAAFAEFDRMQVLIGSRGRPFEELHLRTLSHPLHLLDPDPDDDIPAERFIALRGEQPPAEVEDEGAGPDPLQRVIELLSEHGVQLKKGPGSGPPLVGAGSDARLAWEAFRDAARDPSDLPADDCDDDMLHFGAGWDQAISWRGLGSGPAEDEPRQYVLTFSRTRSIYEDDEWVARVGLNLRIDCHGDEQAGESQIFGYAGPRRDDVSDGHHPEIKSWAGHVDTWATRIESLPALAALESLRPQRFWLWEE